MAILLLGARRSELENFAFRNPSEILHLRIGAISDFNKTDTQTESLRSKRDHDILLMYEEAKKLSKKRTEK
jgi:hypothetical protein